MKAAVYLGPLQLQITEVPDPPCPPDGLRVRMVASAVCGTDVKTYFRGHPLMRPPLVLGHEFVGEVVEVGPTAARQGWRSGDCVTAAPYVGCGRCRACRDGRGQLCRERVGISNGAFAEYMVLPAPVVERATVRLGGGDAQGPEALVRYTLTEPLACVLHSLETVRAGPGGSMVVVGAGAMGLLHVLAARMMGADRVLVADLREERLVLAERLGAVPVRTPSDGPGWAAAVRAVTGDDGIDAAVVAVEADGVLEPLLEMVRPGGVVNLFAGMSRQVRLRVDPFHIHYREVTLAGSFGFDARHFRQAADAIGRLGAALDPLLKWRIDLNQLPEALHAVRDHRVVKAVVTWGRASSQHPAPAVG